MKQVKFNLYVDNEKVRTLDELKAHFNIHDLLDWYEEGVLQKWLSVRGYTNELAQVNAFDGEGTLALAKELVRIFGFSDEQAEHALDSLSYFVNYSSRKQETTTANVSVDDVYARYEEIKKMLMEGVR